MHPNNVESIQFSSSETQELVITCTDQALRSVELKLLMPGTDRLVNRPLLHCIVTAFIIDTNVPWSLDEAG